MLRVPVAVGMGLLIVLAACKMAQPEVQLATVRIGVELGSLVEAGGISPLGVPIDPINGTVGVTEVELTVSRAGTQLFFDAGGNEVAEEDGVPIIFTNAEPSLELSLTHGTYDFSVEARDDEGPPANVLATGELVSQLVDADIELNIPLTTIIDTATLSGPVSVLPNQIFDVFLSVHPPGRSDLNLPTTDFDAGYQTAGGSVQGTSDLGIRVSAQCEEVVIDADVYAPGDTTTSLANDSLTIPVDFTCPTVGGGVGVDLVPPYIDIVLVGGPDYYTTSEVMVNGYVADAESGIASVMLYEGAVELWEALLFPPVDPGDYTIWQLAFLPDMARDYTVTAVATDNAGNQTRTEINFTVLELD